MRIEDIRPAEGSTKNKKRVGRGVGSGHGKTSCKGHKGQKARSGGTKGAGFEGGQMPLQRRVPKRGFTNIFKKEFAIINLNTIDALKDDAVITPELLIEKGIIKKAKDGLKVLAKGSIKRPVTIKANAFSVSAAAKIEAVGGRVEVI
ncbi:MAG: 50S ribosomal protein L15 [Nitrospira bacterium HGW-Nitrospira-1]|nr:ribosomal protein L15 [uncultured bacterium]PKL52395.1 MAG: 50S ribosomal protein L15 [Nitrospira bacterium HGW-Nitrospira-1]